MDIRDSPSNVVRRIDTIRLDEANSTYYTKEGYLIDKPILTSCGIFQYTNPDGSIRRELRLPENVFNPESLASYKGKPIIVTHDAGTIDKNNVSRHEVGTILSNGYRDGDDVRAEIIIHDTNAMESAGLKELSLGYNLDLIEQPGTYKGEHYDAIQTNIRVNHLALVRSARAGEQARLNIDGSDEPILKGGKLMFRKDEGLTPDELKAAIEAYKAKKAGGAGEPEIGEPTPPKKPQPAPQGNEPQFSKPLKSEDDEDEQQSLQPNTGEPKPNNAGNAKQVLSNVRSHMLARQNGSEAPNMQEDIKALVACLNAMLTNVDSEDEEQIKPNPFTQNPFAKKTMPQQDDEEGKRQRKELTTAFEDENQDEEDEFEEKNEDDEDEFEESNEDDDDESQNGAQSDPKMNMDSIEKIVQQKLQICRIGEKLHLDGLDAMSIREGKKAIVKKAYPHMRLDGKGAGYINACFDFVADEINNRKDANYQRLQMTTKSAKRADSKENVSMAEAARLRMISRQEGGNL